MTEDQKKRRRDASRRWRERNPEKQRAATEAWRCANLARSRATAKAWAQANSDHLRDRYLMKRYGVSLDEYRAMETAQAGCCAICGGKPRGGNGTHFNVDHDHATGTVRGLLCHYCNAGIGYLGEDLEVLRSAAEYLVKHGAC